MSWPPVDSAEVAELREAEQATSQLEVDLSHASTCHGGWLGEDQDGRPIPCLLCRPHLRDVACSYCSTAQSNCRGLVGACCANCLHTPPTERRAP